jgi:acetyl esterase/lipase
MLFSPNNNLAAPEPLARLYKRSYFRGTWILTALDAGFFTAMGIKPTWLRHILSIVFSAYYLVFADDAEEKTRKVRATITVEHMRTSWEKGASNPILSFFSSILRPKLSMKKVIQVPRPASSERASLPPVELYLYYAGDLDTLPDQTSLILHFPGGGFVSMPPPCHEDAISQWAAQTGYLICSVNYGKSPEYPYPWAIEECYDVYLSVVESKGKVLGLRGNKDVKIAFIGDSA